MSQKKRTPEREAISRAAGKKLYLDRKLWGCCIICGKPLPEETDFLSCDACLKKRAEYREQNRARIRRYSQERRSKFRAAGLCVYCGKPTIGGKSKCEYHREYYAEMNRRYFKNKNEKWKVSDECRKANA